MKKNRIASILVVALMLSLFSTVAFAEAATNTNVEIVQEMVDRVNESIANDVERAQLVANALIERFGDTPFTQYAVARIIDTLEFVTYQKAQATIKAAEQLGVTVVCEYIEVEVGGQTALIDPMFIVSD